MELFQSDISFLRKTCAIIVLMQGFGLKNKNFGRFSPGQEASKPFLVTVAKVAA
jgi:hypothetical protein